MSTNLYEKREARERKRITGVGIVKAVNSGDSITLMGGIAKGTDGAILSQKNIILSGINSPKLARSRDGKDAEFAFMAKEYLRAKIIGKRVRFAINHTQQNEHGPPRHYAEVYLDNHSLTEYMVRGGYAAVKEGRGGAEREGLARIQEDAKAHGRGMWDTTKVNQIRDVNYSPDPRTLYDTLKGKEIPALVDYVREGHVFRVELLGKHLAHQMITLYLAGVQCPRIPGRDSKEAPEPLAKEARFYSEARLLNREVRVRLHAVDKLNNFYGTIILNGARHNVRHNISINLLEEGYGKVVRWSAPLTGEEKKYAAAQSTGQSRQAHLWAGYDASAPENQTAATADWIGDVVHVHSGDTITVQSRAAPHEKKRVGLASIRCPRFGGRDIPDDPLAMDAREFVRTKLIGKPVKVCVEYSRKQGKYHTNLCSVFFASGVSRTPNEDLGQLLVAAGLARCHRHKPSEDRSRNYNNLILAEDNAVRTAKGMFSKHAAKGGNPIVDFTVRERNPKPKPAAEGEETKVQVELGRDGKPRRPNANAHSRARAILPVLQRKGQMNGVVEHVFSGSKVKLYLPSENAYVWLMFGGIRSPEYNADGDEKQLSNQVTKYVSSQLLQRSVKVDVTAIDQRDNFIGGLWLQKSNFAVHLASKGFASVNRYSAEKTSYKKQLDAAQAKAQEHKRGMWENWVKPEVTETDSKPECYAFKKGECQRGSRCKFSHGDDTAEPTEDEIKTRTNTKGEELINVKITEINDAANFFVTVVGDKAVATVNEQMVKFADELDITAPWDPSTVESGQIYAGRFDGDEGWYRVRVEGKKADGFLRVIFVDYGNRTELSANEIRGLSKELSSIPPLARQCSLAGLVSSFREEWKEASTQVFGEMCFAKEFLARVELKDKNNRLHLSLLTDESKLSINEQLARAGHLRVVERPERGLKAGLLDALKKEEAVAKASYLGVWEYGDVSDSDGEGEEKRFNGKAPRRKY